jgi:tetratricopeptide (TPR) repeat protein
MSGVRLFTACKLFIGSLCALFVSAVYLYIFPAPTIFYAAIVLLHAILGVVVAIALIGVFWKRFRRWGAGEKIAWILFASGAAVGLVLLYTGTPRSRWNLLYAHIILSAAACAFLAALWNGGRKSSEPAKVRGSLVRSAVFLAAVLAIAVVGYQWREVRWLKINVAQQSPAPTSMEGEGDGPRGPFFPSSAQTVDGKTIPGQFFMESESCKRCHQDIYKEWYSSAHHFSSFNNQWYRKSIEYMQDVAGVQPSKWCGGCHDPAVLFSGLMNTPIRDIVNRPESQAGLGCVMCHSIVKVKSTMGQGDFVLEYPELHDLAASKNPVVRAFHDFVIKLNPEPHRRVFLKPFMRTQTAEFCSACHKVHLDFPVNRYRWVRGFNEYDNWQASGVSGEGARSFYYPPQPQQCADCHMPLMHSNDIGNRGDVHSHNFPGANTALPYANQDDAQLALQEQFLKSGAVSVDIFALAPALRRTANVQPQQTDLSTTFAVGEEAESHLPVTENSEVAAPVSAPLNRVGAVVRRGDDVLVEVVVRTRKVGHFFPGGTVDAYDTWLELKATDDNGRVLFWSGNVEDGGKGSVDPTAHFYRSLLIDGDGNPINKRNAWAARATVYVHLIPPGAADTVHYRLHVPSDAGNQINLHATLHYRKFSWYNTHFSFAGMPDPADKGGKFAADFDDRKFIFTADTLNVSGKLKSVPDLPIVSMAEDNVSVKVAPANGSLPHATQALQADDWTRWNDYGIGLFLQGELKGAGAAFEKITEIDPNNADGWTNMGRVAVQEGDLAQARKVLERALSISPRLARANFFYAKVLRQEGLYDEAARRLDIVLAEYPRDRVALNDLTRIYLLQRKYQDALTELNKVFAIDPEDLQGHYTAMLCHQGLGQQQQAEKERTLYLRFKADEAAQTLTGPYRRTHADDNNERQPIHEHVSAPLDSGSPNSSHSKSHSAGSH